MFLKEFRTDTQSLNDWCNVNKLSINTDKSKLMGFGKAMPDASISIAGENMENKESFKYLGIEIDKKMNFNMQTVKVCTKISKFNGVKIDKIFLAQKKIIRTIFFLRKYDHVSEYFFKIPTSECT